METKGFVVTEGELAVLRSIMNRLYSQQRLSGDDMRNMAQKIDGVLAAAIPIVDEDEGA